jgi:catechol 2,3-dioxygenase-like lactoylglutathione lyase family enzyme
MPLDHVSVGSNDIAAARAFYRLVLAPLGMRIVEEEMERFVDFGLDTIEFSIEMPVNGKAATTGNGVHICFRAPSRTAVTEFHARAVAAGGRCAGPPGLRPQYHPDYFGAFVYDLDGNKIEAVCHDAEAV